MGCGRKRQRINELYGSVTGMLSFTFIARCCMCHQVAIFGSGFATRVGHLVRFYSNTCGRWIFKVSCLAGVAWLIKHFLLRQLSRDSSVAPWVEVVHRPAGVFLQLLLAQYCTWNLTTSAYPCLCFFPFCHNPGVKCDGKRQQCALLTHSTKACPCVG